MVSFALAPLSSVYYRYTFGDTVRNVSVENLLHGNADAHINAIWKIGGDWKEPKDWTPAQVTSFCRDIADENITELILILTNSNMTDPLPAGDTKKVFVQASTTGCEGYAGWAKTTLHVHDGSQDMTYTTQQVPLRFKPKPVQDEAGVVQYDLVAGSAAPSTGTLTAPSAIARETVRRALASPAFSTTLQV